VVLIRRFFVSTQWLGLTLLVVLALGLAVTRLLLYKADAYLSFIEQQVSQYVDAPVRITKVRARMQGLNPELLLKGVRILDSHQRQSELAFDEIRLGLDMIRLLTHGELVPGWVSVVGAKLTIRRHKAGGLSIIGLKSTDDPPNWLFDEGYFELLESNIEWQDLKREGQKLHFSDVDISIVNTEGHHRIGVAVALPESLGQNLTVAMDYHGNLFAPNCCTGQLYIEGEEIHLPNLFVGQSFMAYEISNGTGDFQLWSDWVGSQVQSVSGHLNLRQPALQKEDKFVAQSISLEHLEGWFKWQKCLEGWRLDANKLEIGFKGNRWPSNQLAIETAYNQTGKLDAFNSTVSYLGIEDLMQLVSSSNLLTKQQQTELVKISPKGEISDFSMRYVHSTNDAQVVEVCGDFDGVYTNSWGHYPGLKNIGGFVCTDSSHGVIGLKSNEAEIDLPTLFRHPLALESIIGEINWEHTGDNWKVDSDSIQIVTHEVDTYTRFEINSGKGNASPFLDLQVAFDGKNAENVPLYLPVKMMDEDVVDWLDHAFVAGRVDNGQLLYHGPVQAFPFDHGQGVFQCRFNVSDTVLVYHEEWPEITKLEGDVRFDNRMIVINAGFGLISGAQIDNAVVVIPDAVDGDILTVLGNAQGNVEQSMDFLSRSPLRNRINPLLQIADFKGKNQINLELVIPLDDNDLDANVQGIAELSDSRIHLNALDLAATGINGHLSFTANGLNVEDASGILLDAPAEIRLFTQNNHFNLQVDSVASIIALKQQFPYSFWNVMSGKANYQMLLKIPKLDKAGPLFTDVSLMSNLQGIKVSLPEPLGKSKSGEKEFRFDLALAQSEKTSIKLRYADIAGADVVFSEPESDKFEFERGSITIGNNNPEAGDLPGLNLSLKLDELKLEPWWSLYISQAKSQNTSPELLNSIQLIAEEISWGEENFGPVSLNVKKQQAGWLAGIKSRYVTGQSTIPFEWNNNALLTMDLESINIPNTNLQSTETDSQSFFDLTKLPRLALKSKHLFWKNIDLGSSELQTRYLHQGLNIDYLTVESENHLLSLSGLWTRSDLKDETDVHGQLDIEDIGRFLKLLKIKEDIVESAADIGFNFRWIGSPQQFSLDRLNGKVALELNPGRLLGIEPGLGRAFGVFNLDTWRRRLAFDFSDLYAEGMAYDKVKGEFNIENGDAHTEDLFIDGVVARIYGSGHIDLSTKDFDQLITVVPKSTASLPIAGAIAGGPAIGPAIGAAIFVAQKLIGDDVDSIASTQYSMTGHWDDPKIVRLPGKGGMLDRALHGIMDFSGFNTDSQNNEEKLE